MNILLVEDNNFKRKIIETNLKTINPDVRIRHFSDLRSAEYFVDRNAELIDLLVLDWCFPENKLEKVAQIGTGKLMLDYIKEKNVFIKTVICSGNEIDGEELHSQYNFVLGAVLFGSVNAGKAIMDYYADYWKQFCESYRDNFAKAIIPTNPITKKLVNEDVK